MEKTTERNSCCKVIEVPSDDEVTALNGMRRIKGEVRLLKKQMSEMETAGMESDSEKRSALEQELAKLKAEWNAWEEKRKEAERVRMILLGHEEGPL